MRDTGARLVLDRGGQIQSHYLRKMPGQYGPAWVAEMASRGLIRPVSRATISKGVAVKLTEAGFSSRTEDYKYYARTAAGGECFLVTCDPHFVSNAKTLKQAGIAVISPSAACECLRSLRAAGRADGSDEPESLTDHAEAGATGE